MKENLRRMSQNEVKHLFDNLPTTNQWHHLVADVVAGFEPDVEDIASSGNNGDDDDDAVSVDTTAAVA